MGFGIDYPAFGSVNPLTTTLANTPYTAIDTFNSALENNGASQLLGSLYQAPLVPTGSATSGGGLNAYLKYVRYNPTTSETIQAGPALVYWKDETFTTVTSLGSESFLGTAAPASVAGWLLYNTTTLASAAASLINGNFCWILVGGFLPGAFVTAATAGDSIFGVSGGAAWATGHTAYSAAATSRVAGIALTTASGASLSDLYVPFLN